MGYFTTVKTDKHADMNANYLLEMYIAIEHGPFADDCLLNMYDFGYIRLLL